MSIPKTGSRRVKVDGVEYLWRVRKQPTHSQALTETRMTLAVQAAAGRSVLVVDLGVTRPDNCLRPHQTQLRPRMVREMIRTALEGGWLPESDTGFSLRYPIIMDV
ncbi:MAG: hypothetical protein SangKO_034960 [Sandaracinaceae bacterium]